ncbi:MAG: DUF2333 family protein [Pseudohongiellaceae bacterium]|nr:DUF2333 family protein [Pseudohongiellaceae bacterium]
MFKKVSSAISKALPLERMGNFAKAFLLAFVLYLVLVLILGIVWSREPDAFSVTQVMEEQLAGRPAVVGAATSSALIHTANVLLDKPGGFISNDISLPGLYLDNIPNWEFGVLVQARDLSRAFRENFSRSQSQSTEDPDLVIVEPQFHFPNDSWLFPPSEGEYRKAVVALESYLARISDSDDSDAQFYARADNLARWLSNVESRLGSLSQRLSASVGQNQMNIDMAGEPSAAQSTASPGQRMVKTPYFEIDDVFYEARGATWALLHFLKAVEVDFESVLRDKNALVSMRQIIRELEASQKPVFSPVILNGSGFGLFANHSLVMANYVSRANAAIIDLRELLNQG